MTEYTFAAMMRSAEHVGVGLLLATPAGAVFVAYLAGAIGLYELARGLLLGVLWNGAHFQFAVWGIGWLALAGLSLLVQEVALALGCLSKRWWTLPWTR